jgi:pyruvate/2-oxoglutarate dehydrogenase complex dihydrolipoamide dehydrogenase (E3) component
MAHLKQTDLKVSDIINPVDEHNTKLVSNVRPLNWENPTPAKHYNLIVIGAGTAGLVTAAGAAALGAKVALIEKHLMGGDCLNVGCVPSKAVIRASSFFHQVKMGHQLGLRSTDAVTMDFAKVWQRMRKLRAKISPHDSAERFTKMGIDVFFGEASFKDRKTISVAGEELKFAKAVIATGAKARIPIIPGLQEINYLDNQTVFELTEQPQSMAFIGGGPIGCELAQTFQRLGTRVTILEHNKQFLSKEDPDAANLLKEQFIRDGLDIRLGVEIEKIEAQDGFTRLFVNKDGQREHLDVEAVFVGTGRTANTANLGLEAAGVEQDKFGVKTNDYLQTSNPRIYAAGDVCMKRKFTHAADFAARIVIQNALFSVGPFGKKKLSLLEIPWCTYTDPEIAHVGLYLREAKEQGIEIDTYRKEFSDVDRAILEGRENGFVKVHVLKGTDKILGATIVGENAGDLIGECAVALTQKVGLKKLSNVIHPYPTKAEAIRQTGDLFNKSRLTPTIKSILSTIIRIKN